MPYKNKQDKLDWTKANQEKNADYRRRWLESQKGQAYLAKQKAKAETQKQLNYIARLARQEVTKIQRRNKQKIHREKDREIAIRLLGGCCMACGMDDPDVLEFDHIQPLHRKTNNIKNKSGASSEIIKRSDRDRVFQLLCANCHRKKTRINKDHLASTPTVVFEQQLDLPLSSYL